MFCLLQGESHITYNAVLSRFAPIAVFGSQRLRWPLSARLNRQEGGQGCLCEQGEDWLQDAGTPEM